jgi:hypothetical protein
MSDDVDMEQVSEATTHTTRLSGKNKIKKPDDTDTDDDEKDRKKVMTTLQYLLQETGKRLDREETESKTKTNAETAKKGSHVCFFHLHNTHSTYTYRLSPSPPLPPAAETIDQTTNGTWQPTVDRRHHSGCHIGCIIEQQHSPLNGTHRKQEASRCCIDPLRRR